MIAIFDEDGGGNVDFQEFVSGLSAFSSKGNKEQKLEFAFKVYDIDRDGYISNGELFIVLKMMVGSNLKDQQLQQIVDKTIMEADLDGDGKISFDEFKKMVENTDVSMSMTLGMLLFSTYLRVFLATQVLPVYRDVHALIWPLNYRPILDATSHAGRTRTIYMGYHGLVIMPGQDSRKGPKETYTDPSSQDTRQEFFCLFPFSKVGYHGLSQKNITPACGDGRRRMCGLRLLVFPLGITKGRRGIFPQLAQWRLPRVVLA